jgi:anti-sigma factor RsiW
MSTRDHSTFREWLSLEADGALPVAQAAELDRHVADCGECQQERASYAALAKLLEGASLEVRPDFGARVMAALPAAGWEGRNPRAWAAPAALCLVLGVTATLLLSKGSASLGTASAALLAIAGMLNATFTAGAGLLNASWKGLGMVVQQGLASRLALGVFGFLVLCLNLLLVSLVRRRGSAASLARARDGGR